MEILTNTVSHTVQNPLNIKIFGKFTAGFKYYSFLINFFPFSDEIASHNSMGKKDNNVGNATGYNKKDKIKKRAKKKDQNIFQLGPNVDLWACAKKQKLKYLICIQLAGKYALSVAISYSGIFVPTGQRLVQRGGFVYFGVDLSE